MIDSSIPLKSVPPPDAPELHDLGHCVKRVMLAKNYSWFPDQNTVSVEGMDPDGAANGNRHDAFDDIKMVLDGEGRIIGGPWEATTQPGRFWTDNPMASGGAFIIALGPQSCWSPGPYRGLTVWRQAENSTIMGTRDPDGTYLRQGNPIRHGNIGIHHHGGHDMPRSAIRRTAAGCQVIRLEEMQAEFMRITLRNPPYLKDPRDFRLTATVLEAKDVGIVEIAPAIDEVRMIQEALNAVLHLDPPLPVDGNYGRLTRLAVRAFQAAHGLFVDGIAGEETLPVLRTARAAAVVTLR
jgi:hypothetical protein